MIPSGPVVLPEEVATGEMSCEEAQEKVAMGGGAAAERTAERIYSKM